MMPYERLEHELANWPGTGGLYRPEQVVCCSSGTAALHLALEAFRLPPGSEILCPDFTMVACPRAIALANLTPVFVDCDERLLMDKQLVLRAELGPTEESPAAVGVMLVHVYGRRVDADFVTRRRGTGVNYRIVEDLAEAHGIPPHPDTDAACWSWYRNKIIAGEEGGAVAFKDPEHAALARQLRTLGFTAAHDFTHTPRGHNYRLANCLAEKVLASLRAWNDQARYGGVDAKRRDVERWYDEACPAEWRMPPRESPWVYDLRIPGLTPDRQTETVRALNAAGIAARHAFKPMSRQEEFARCRLVRGKVHEAARAAQEIIYLPLTPGTTIPATARRAFDVIRGTVAR